MASYRAVAKELRITNDSLLSARQNEVMKRLTVVSLLVLPLSLIAAVFGMNVQNAPFVGHPYDFWLIVALMLVTGVTFFLYFRFKKWL